ncbi:MAG: hypothetical protein GY705_29935, partial [Bacteroidetes bacterium]|nr:hypothetical protein [Bacteroidota bacterium]
SLLADKDPTSNEDDYDPNEKVVERFLKHIKDPTKRKVALRSALARKLNKDIIAVESY